MTATLDGSVLAPPVIAGPRGRFVRHSAYLTVRSVR